MTAGSLNGHHAPDSHISVSHATRYLSAAAHLRHPMLPNEITEAGWADPRRPMPVGRSYARRVLRDAEGLVPVSAVDISEVQRHCRIALRQTWIRDGAAVAVLIASGFLEPWGTIVTFGLVVVVIVLAGRVRLFSPLTFAAAAGIILALVSGGRREQISLAVPLIGLVACFIIYMTDALLSAHHVRRIWRQSSAQPEPSRQDNGWSTGPNGQHNGQHTTTTGYYRWPYADATNGDSPDHLVQGGNGSNGVKVLTATSVARVYYDKHGIVGAGEAVQHLTLTVPLDRPRRAGSKKTFSDQVHPAESTTDGLRKIKKFSAAELIDDIGRHIQSLGSGDGQVHGLSYRPTKNGKGQVAALEPGYFTYGLPYLDVCRVVAEPVPKAKKHPVKREGVLTLRYNIPPTTDDFLRVADRSPSEHPDRCYLRISSSSWDGQLVASIYLNAALQGHFLRLVMRPYVLAPVVPDLKVADELAERHPLIVICIAVKVAVLHFVWVATRLHDLTTREGKQAKAATSKPGLRGTREHYAQVSIGNIHQYEDSRRIIAILEQKIVTVTMGFLRKHNIDVGEYEQQVQNYLIQQFTVGTGNIIADSKVANSPMTNVGQVNTGAGSASGSGPQSG